MDSLLRSMNINAENNLSILSILFVLIVLLMFFIYLIFKLINDGKIYLERGKNILLKPIITNYLAHTFAGVGVVIIVINSFSNQEKNIISAIIESACVVIFAIIIHKQLLSIVTITFIQKSIKRVAEKVPNLHPVALKFMFDLLNDTLADNKHFFKEHLKNSNVENILEIASSLTDKNGLKMSNELFARLLRNSTSFYPREIKALWNMNWYPPEEIFKGEFDAGKLLPDATWSPYFNELKNAYSSKFIATKNRQRIFITPDMKMLQMEVEAENFFYINPTWYELLKLQAFWRIRSQWFCRSGNGSLFQESVGDKFKDFVTFKHWKFKSYWIVGQKEKNGEVRIATDGAEVEIYTNFYDALINDTHTLESRLVENKRCIEIYHGGNKLYDVPLDIPGKL